MVTLEHIPDHAIERRGDGRIDEGDASVLPADRSADTSDNVTPLADRFASMVDDAAPRESTAKAASILKAPEDVSLMKRQVGDQAYAQSIGFSPAVAQRVALRRPDVLKLHKTLAAAEPSLKPVYTAYRGLNDLSLAEFRPRFNAPSYVVAGAAGLDPKKTWAMHFVVSGKPGVVAPSAEQLVRGFLLELEIPAHLIRYMDTVDYSRGMAKTVSEGGAFVASIEGQAAPDLSPFINRVGFVGADGALHFHPFEHIFARDGQLTALGKRINSQMVGPSTPR